MTRISPGKVSLSRLREQLEPGLELKLPVQALEDIQRSYLTVHALCEQESSVYGLNTGFGKLAQTKVVADDLALLQTNLVLSHCCGVGEPFEDATVRLLLLLKVMSLSRGYSGIAQSTVDALVALLNADVLPVIPSKGSVGASGDLAPLAHMSAALLGVGQVRINGETISATAGLSRLGLAPLQLQAKEGLALINGTQASTALALHALFRIERLFSAAIVIGAMTVDAMQGSDAPFDDRIHQVRGHQSQIKVAAMFRQLLQGSAIRASHVDCDRVQDPYSLRCQPQVMGAVLNSIGHAAEILLVESNGVTDNPLIFPSEQEALSGGNFHAEPVALVSDSLAVALAEIGALSERRLANLVDTQQSGLPPFLVAEAGLNSGFMIAQVTAAALASENKSLAHPASVDSLPTSANQEDHVSMATFAARRLHDMVDNVAGILGIELLAAAQGIDFHTHETSDELSRVVQEVRKVVPHYDKDRYFADDIAWAAEFVQGTRLCGVCSSLLPSYA